MTLFVAFHCTIAYKIPKFFNALLHKKFLHSSMHFIALLHTMSLRFSTYFIALLHGSHTLQGNSFRYCIKTFDTFQCISLYYCIQNFYTFQCLSLPYCRVRNNFNAFQFIIAYKVSTLLNAFHCIIASMLRHFCIIAQMRINSIHFD